MSVTDHSTVEQSVIHCRMG